MALNVEDRDDHRRDETSLNGPGVSHRTHQLRHQLLLGVPGQEETEKASAQNAGKNTVKGDVPHPLSRDAEPDPSRDSKKDPYQNGRSQQQPIGMKSQRSDADQW